MKRGIEKSAVLVRRDYTTSGNYNKSNGRKSKTGKNTYDKQTPGQYHLSDMRADSWMDETRTLESRPQNKKIANHEWKFVHGIVWHDLMHQGGMEEAAWYGQRTALIK